MLQFPHPTTAPEADNLTDQILILASLLQQVPITPQAATKIFHQQFLKSSLFSARIEGNTLTLIEAEQSNLKNPKTKSKKEINNILRALQHIQNLKKDLTISEIKQIHQIIMDQIEPDAGKLRSESSAIFDQFGNVVYLTPSSREAKSMLQVFLTELNQQKTGAEIFSQIANCHYYFEKIHPFIDGNGRLGRVILQLQIQKTGIFGPYILPIDQYFEAKRSEYYFHLEKNTRNIEEFVIFFLKGIIYSIESILSDIKNANAASSQQQPQQLAINLLPRRQEILLIIQDHPYISMDMVTRRFPTIPKRTIAFDMQWLVQKHFVIKHGSTRGVRYSAAEATQ